MKRRDLLLSIIAVCGERPDFGRTSLQKVAYFVGLTSGADLQHRAYYFGPFSEVVEREVQTLVISDLIQERIQPLGFVGAEGFEGRRYEYHLAAAGRERFDQLRVAYPEEVRALETFIGKLIQAAGGLDQKVLSTAAKTFFIAQREGRPLDAEEIKQLARQLGWTVSHAQVERVLRVLHDLEFMEPVPSSSN